LNLLEVVVGDDVLILGIILLEIFHELVLLLLELFLEHGLLVLDL
jgi:hypothetical protein